MQILKGLLLLALGAFSATAVAQRALVPIVDYKDVSIATSSGKPVSAEQVREAIITAGKRLNWQMGITADGSLVGTLVVNNKHTISVDIAIAPEKYSVTYRSSINMKYTMAQQEKGNFRDGTAAGPFDSRPVGPERPVIHPAYNQWVQALVSSIDTELRRL